MDTMEGGGGAAREGSGRPSAGPFATESEAESEPFEAGEEVTLPLPPTPTPTPTPPPNLGAPAQRVEAVTHGGAGQMGRVVLLLVPAQGEGEG